MCKLAVESSFFLLVYKSIVEDSATTATARIEIECNSHFFSENRAPFVLRYNLNTAFVHAKVYELTAVKCG